MKYKHLPLLAILLWWIAFIGLRFDCAELTEAQFFIKFWYLYAWGIPFLLFNYWLYDKGDKE